MMYPRFKAIAVAMLASFALTGVEDSASVACNHIVAVLIQQRGHPDVVKRAAISKRQDLHMHVIVEIVQLIWREYGGECGRGRYGIRQREPIPLVANSRGDDGGDELTGREP